MVSLCSVWLVYVMYGYSGIISTIRKETTRKVTTRKELATGEITITITRTTTTTTAITTSVWLVYVMYGYSGIISTIRKETTRKGTTRKELL